MMYRFSSSFFALLLCMELGASPSLKAMQEEDNIETHEKRIPLSKEEREKAIEKARKNLSICQNVLEIKFMYEIYSALSPEDIESTDYALAENISLISGNIQDEILRSAYLKESLHFLSLAIMRKSNEPSINIIGKTFIKRELFSNSLCRWLDALKNQYVIQAYNKVQELSKMKMLDLKNNKKPYAQNINILLDFVNQNLTSEAYEIFFLYNYNSLFNIDQEFGNQWLKIIYNTKKPKSIWISYMYCERILAEKDYENKYETLKKIATAPLFIHNSPPRHWITDAKPMIIRNFVKFGLKLKKFEILKEYCKNNINDFVTKNFNLMTIYFANKEYEKALEHVRLLLREKPKKDIKLGYVIYELALLRNLGKYEDAQKIADKNQKIFKQASRLADFKGDGKLTLLAIFGKDKEANEGLLKLQKESLKRSGYHLTPTTKQSPSKPKNDSKPSSVSKEQISSLQKEPIKKTAPKKDEVRKEKKESPNVNNNNMPQEKINTNIPNLKKNIINHKIDNNKSNEITYYPSSNSSQTSRENKKEISEFHNQKKEKIKRKGVSNPPQENNNNNNNNPPINLEKEEKKDITTLLSGTPLKTLHKLFRPFSEKLGWDKLNISYSKIESLFKALDHKTGIPTGDHVKVTINKEGQFDNNENNTNKENETMLTLVKKTKVCAAALKQIALTFIEYGIWPSELEETLREQGHLPKKEN
jgi:hypothetical protein